MDGNATIERTSSDVAVITNPDALQAAFSAPDDDGLQRLLNQIKAGATGEVPDLTTAKGRARIASLAAKVASSKTTIDKFGKNLGADMRAQINAINARRNVATEFLDNLKAEVRAPLTEWEESEKKRISGHEKTIADIKDCVVSADEPSAHIERAISHLRSFDTGEAMQEFQKQAEDAKSATLLILNDRLTAAKDREQQQAELAKLRAEAEERRKADEARALAEAEATKAAEEKAAAERRKEAEAKAIADAAEQAREDERRKAEQAAAENKARVEKAEADAIEAARRAEKAEEDAKTTASLAVARERAEAVERAEQAARQERSRREDAEHRKAVFQRAADSLTAGGVSKSASIKAVELIAAGAVPNITMSF